MPRLDYNNKILTNGDYIASVGIDLWSRRLQRLLELIRIDFI